MLLQFMHPKGEWLENNRWVDTCQKLNTSTKAANVLQLSDTLIIELNILNVLMYQEKCYSKMSIDEEISLWDNSTLWCASFDSF